MTVEMTATHAPCTHCGATVDLFTGRDDTDNDDCPTAPLEWHEVLNVA